MFPQSGTSPALHLTAGYHSVRLEFVETYGENHFTLYWKGPGITQQVVPAGVLFHCTGSTAPLEPANLSATALDGAVALAWSASPFATSYAVKRATTPGGPYAAMPDVLTTTSWRDTTVANGTTYYYVVTATGSGGTSFYSNEACATPVAAPVTVNLDYHPSSGIYMNGTASNSAADLGTASRVAPLDYDGINASATAVNFWNAGSGGTAALANLKNSEGVATTIGVTAVLPSHGSSSTLSAGLGGNKLLKGGVTLTQANLPGFTPLIKLSGLSTSHVYQLALPSQTGTSNTSISYRVGTVQQTAANGGAASDWRSGLNHALLDGLIPNAAGEIHLQAMVNTSSTAALNGWQLLDMGDRAAGANSYTTIDSCSFGALGAATISGSNISITVPYGTAIGALTPTFVAAAGATLTPSTAQNFASPVTYRVTAENGAAYQDYVVTIIVAPNVTTTITAPAITAAATGGEILSTGTLIAANHGGSTAVAPVTLDNGLTFGISTAHLTSGWGASNQRTDTDSQTKVPLLDGTTAFGRFMRSYIWSSSYYYYLDIPGLTVGHTYRLQLVSPNPANCKVAVEGTAAVTWSGTTPSLMTACWTAKDTVANIVLARISGEIFFHGYALHDVSPDAQPAPAGLAATGGDGQVALSWNAAPGATRYTVKRSTTTGGPYSTISTATGTSYLDLSLTNGIRYYYVISATTALGDTPDSEQASALPARVNHAPVAIAQSATTAEDTANTITLTASDADGDALAFQMVGSPAHGSVTGTAPELTYTPAANYNGSDSFTFQANDGLASSAETTVSITVTPVNDAPVAAAQSVSVGVTAQAITLAASDAEGDALTYQIVSTPAHGTLSGNAPDVSYTPATGYTGTDSFTFKANDGKVDSASATVNLTVTFLNVSTTGTGAEILNTGTLVAANHFGGVSDGMAASAAVTLANGLTFGTSLAHMTSPGWLPVHSTSTDAHDKVPLLTDTNFKALMRSYLWVAYGSSVSRLDIPGLTVGKTYRLQLISPNPANCAVTVEGGSAVTWSGTTPSVLTTTWLAADTTANVVLTRMAGEIDFNGYALHEVPPPVPPTPASVVATPGCNSVSLTWNAASGATGYKVKRATVSGGPFTTTFGTPAATSYLDTTALNGTTYYYVVAATNFNGDSADSSQVSARPDLQTTTTDLTSSPATICSYGGVVTFTATVTAGATGTVTFKDAVSVLGTGALSAGQASLVTSGLAAGSYSITATYGGDATFATSTSSALSYTITPAAASITLGNLSHIYNGTPKNAMATTIPEGLTITLTYDGFTTAPVAVGSYAVVATVADLNYSGTANATLVIGAESITAWRSGHFTPVEITAGLAADTGDPDGDGFSNLTEYVLGTDPHDFTQRPLVIATAPANHITLSFLARRASGSGYAGLTRSYDLQTSNDPANPAAWQAVPDYTNITGNDQQVVISLPVNAIRKFHRLKVRLE